MTPISKDPTGAYARAQALEAQGQVAEAEAIYRSLLRAYPEHPTLLHSLALALKSRREFAESENLMRRSIALSPRDAAFHNNLGNLLRAKGKLPEAEGCYRQAIALKPDYPEAHYNLGITLNELGRAEESLAEFERAVALNPRYVQAITRIGAHYFHRDAYEEALARFDTALAILPDYFDANYYRGLTLSALERYADALAALERALAANPTSVQTLANLALMAARQSDSSRVRECAARVLAIDPRQAVANIALAMVELAEGETVSAERRLRPLLDNQAVSGNQRAFVFGLLGDALDHQDKVAEAFAAYTSENNELFQTHAARFAGSGGRSQIARLIDYFERAGSQQWSAPTDNRAADGETLQHVFLVGFMRSGTTLLEQVLAANPSLVTLEERDIFGETADIYLKDAASLGQLCTLDGDELVRHREAYWQRVRNHAIDVSGKVFLNKHPLNTLKLPLIAKLFPRAKILFAIRDPRDVVFSCFRRHFGMNAATYELLTLEGAASFYDDVMRLANLYRKCLMLELCMHRYEDMVSDFEGSMHAVCRFIGVDWMPAMQDFAEVAKARPIRSVSAAQVRRGLYREGLGQWRRYANELAPILPKLQPWIDEFGYAAGVVALNYEPKDSDQERRI
ncbi:MAG: tetratricopeptide repeat protein [Alphaproteobacteria bacterium]